MFQGNFGCSIDTPYMRTMWHFLHNLSERFIPFCFRIIPSREQAYHIQGLLKIFKSCGILPEMHLKDMYNYVSREFPLVILTHPIMRTM